MAYEHMKKHEFTFFFGLPRLFSRQSQQGSKTAKMTNLSPRPYGMMQQIRLAADMIPMDRHCPATTAELTRKMPIIRFGAIALATPPPRP